MSLAQDFNLLSQLTEPQLVGKVTRVGYVQIDAALCNLFAALKPQMEAEQAAAKLPPHGTIPFPPQPPDQAAQ